jgi:hypothetical protein
VTGKNPNVNYELGLCHALGVPTVLITQTIADVPFDYRHRRCIEYRPTSSTWAEKLATDLQYTIRAVLSRPDSDHELSWPYDTGATQVDESDESPAEQRRSFLRGTTRIERLISKAFGPRGAYVSVTLASREAVSTKQGSVISENIRAANKIVANGIEQMRKVSWQLSNTVGDGTKTAMLLMSAVVERGQNALEMAYPLKDVLHGMTMAMAAARSSIIGSAQVCDSDALAMVAATAAGSKEMADLVVRAFQESGKDGIMVVDTKSGGDTKLVVQEGFRLDRGYLSPHFVTNLESDTRHPDVSLAVLQERVDRIVAETIRVSKSADPTVAQGAAIPLQPPDIRNTNESANRGEPKRPDAAIGRHQSTIRWTAAWLVRGDRDAQIGARQLPPNRLRHVGGHPPSHRRGIRP